MILKCCSFVDMAEDIKKNKKKIVMFGAGVVGQITVPEIIKTYGLGGFLDCYLDNDLHKWGDYILVEENTYEIRSPQYLSECGNNTVIFINISRFAEVIEQLEQMNCTKAMTAYIMPMMCIHNWCSEKSGGNPELSNEPLIPKVIHYMWLGKQSLPKEMEYCIESWQRYCPDYEIVRWDESNYDVHKNDFVSQAYDNGKFGFVPDYARLDILYNYGGIYLDTDVEMIKNPDKLLCQEAFCGVEKWQVVNFGSFSGAVKGHKSLEPFLERWERRKLIKEDGTLDSISSGLIDTDVALKRGYKINGLSQNVNGMNIYSYDHFNPYDYMTGRTTISENTYSIHHFNNSWLDEKSRAANRRTMDEYDNLEKMCLKDE